MWIKKFFVVCTVMLSIMFLLTGCWDRKELKDLGVIGAIGVDDDLNGINVSFEIIKAKSAKATVEEQESALYLQAKGKSITEALNQASYKFENKLFLPHCNEYIFSQAIAKKGLIDILDYFNREHETRRYVDVIVSMDKASEIVGVGRGLEKNPSLFHESLFENSSQNLKSVRVRLLDFFIAYCEEGIEPVAELIQKVKKPEIGAQNEEKDTKASKEPKEQFEINAEGAAVFKDDKLVGFLDGNQTMGYNLIKGDAKDGSITVTYPKNKQISFTIMKGSSKKKVIVEGETVKAQISVKLKVSVAESSYREDIESIEAAAKIQDKISEQIKEQLQVTVERTQELKSDICGLGQVLHRTQPKKWKELKADWNSLFSKMPVDIDVDTEIIRYGVSNEQVGRIIENNGED